MMCKKCSGMTGWMILIAGILLLLVDLGVIGLAGISWATLAFLIIGFTKIGAGCCKMCQASCSTETKSKKK